MEFFMRMKLILGVMVLGFTACSNKKQWILILLFGIILFICQLR